MNNSRKKEVAKRIAALESDKFLSSEEKEEAIMDMISTYNISLMDLLELDDMIMGILKK